MTRYRLKNPSGAVVGPRYLTHTEALLDLTLASGAVVGPRYLTHTEALLDLTLAIGAAAALEWDVVPVEEIDADRPPHLTPRTVSPL